MNLRLHLIVSALFLLLIFGALFTFSMNEHSQEEADASPSSDRFIQIVKATWGSNCNGFIEDFRQQHAAQPLQTPPLPEPVRENNALRAVSSLCNGKQQCQFAVAPETLGFDPVAKCHKFIEVEYRCLETDRSHAFQSEDGGTVAINCQQDETP